MGVLDTRLTCVNFALCATPPWGLQRSTVGPCASVPVPRTLTRRMASNRGALEGLPRDVLDLVMCFLDARDMARLAGTCTALRAAAAGSAAWTAVMCRETAGRAGPPLQLEGGPGAARREYTDRARAQAVRVAAGAVRAGEGARWRRRSRRRVRVAGALHAWTWLCTAAPAALFFAWLLIMALKLDGVVSVGWYGAFGVLAAAPGCALLDALVGAVVQGVRVATWGRDEDGETACSRASCVGLWSFFISDDTLESRRGAACGSAAFIGAAFALLGTWFLLIPAKLEGHIDSSWGVVCVPLWLLFAMSWCVMCSIAANTKDADESVLEAMVVVVASPAFGCGFCLYFLSTAASLVAWADGAGFALNRAFIPVWIADVSVLAGCCGVAPPVFQWARREAGRLGAGRCGRVSAGLTVCGSAVLIAWGVAGCVILTPILLVLNVEGHVSLSWRAVLAPALVTTAAMAIAALGAALYGLIYSCKRVRSAEEAAEEAEVADRASLDRGTWGRLNTIA